MLNMNSDLGPAIAKTALVTVAGALGTAGLYVLLAKPSSHEGRVRKQHIVNGFRLGGGIFLGIILMGSLVGCSQIALGIVQSTRLSRIAALFIALGSLALIFSMIQLWAKHFVGWVGYGVRNGLLMISTGHLVNNPSIVVPRWWSTSTTALVFISAIASTRFLKKYTLSGTDKAALIIWLLSFTFAVDVESTRAAYHEQLGLASMSAGCVALVAAWWHYHATHHQRHHQIGQINRSAQPSD